MDLAVVPDEQALLSAGSIVEDDHGARTTAL